MTGGVGAAERGVERRNGPGRAWARGVVGYIPGDSGFSVVVLF